LFDPEDFLRVADSLGTPGSQEAELRTAVGRTYYALFLLARAKARVHSGNQIHQLVIAELKKLPGYRPVGEQLDRLRRLRVIADYQMLPADPQVRDWQVNWAAAQAIARRVLPRLR
jgi:hypothetical protein